MIVWTIFQKWPRGFTFLTTGFKLTMGCSFSLTTGLKCPLMRVQKWTPPLPTCHKFSDQLKSKQRIPATANVPESLVFSGFPDILFISFVSIKRFTFLCKRCLWYNSIFPYTFWFFPDTFWFFVHLLIFPHIFWFFLYFLILPQRKIKL